MSKDKRDKLIYAGLIGLAFILAMVFTRLGPKSFLKENDEIIIEENGEDILAKQNNLVGKEVAKSSDVPLEMKVHITGEVLNPGVYEIKENDRLEDLIAMAGGFKEGADIDMVNLALRLEDQMKIYIPSLGERKEEELSNVSGLADLGEAQGNNTKININTAGKEELMTLPNIGEKRAEAIIEYRKTKRFEKIEDIKNVSGIGDKFFEAMKDLIIV